MKQIIAASLVVSLCSVQLTGCAEMTQTQKGAGIGAAAGAVLGSLTGGDRKSILIGAALGAIAGAIIANYQDKQTASRAEAERKYGTVTQDKLEIDSSTLTPDNVMPGDKVESAVQYTALAAREAQQFKVTETRTLMNDKESVQLASREVVRTQGSHVSTMKFTLPKDVAKGDYTLVTTVSDGKNTRTVKNPMRVV
ncbi:MAG: glycine zipper domain-containing protein [Sulfurimicrobium sp.]|nr:glycine zipper domain-containing protein [Sulfurimicrobium sp.]MDP1703904.1 glycine zipper domain-containing protein [Sulfurimicrobium sp.]MDP2198453.1 glycine zipper domain-containing protein [Sulfurimicrobium sp.]MDP3689250.1 glycine zipper domain-containing protein [Sulfurimicrobium sp.]